MRHLNSYLVLATLFFSCFVCYIVALIKDLKTGTLHIFLHQPVLGLQFQDLILNWNSVSNASKYNVYYSQSSSNGPIANNEQAADFQSLVGFLNGIPRDLDVRFEPFVSPLPKAFLCRVHP